MTQQQVNKMKKQFEKLDRDGDGTLSFQELHDLLKKGNPTFTEPEVQTLYNACDSNNDGRVSFDEFLEYVFGHANEHAQDRAPGGRHAAKAAASGPKVDDSETKETWDKCHEVFKHYGDGTVVDQTKYAKLVKDTKWIGHGFKQPDIDMIFMKVVTKGQRKITFPQFQDAVRLAAAKRQQENSVVMDLVAGGSGPVLTGTKQDAVRFYDDKTTFTGAHAHNDNYEGVDHGSHAADREARIHAAEEGAAHASDGAELPWDGVKAKFDDFAGKDAVLEGREFKKFVEQTPGMFCGDFKKTDVDLCFTKVAKKEKKIDFEMFKDVCRQIAIKQGKGLGHVQRLIESGEGQKMSGTKADAVRFHDDKSTYTGAHGDVHGRTDDRGAGRHESAKGAAAGKLTEPGEDEGDWTKCDEVFSKFGGDDGLDGKETMKFCIQTGLIDKKKFTAQSVDILFASVNHGARKMIGLEAFHAYVRGVAIKKELTVGEVQAILEKCEGPTMNATEADYVAFHDDPSTYTGAHVGK